MWLKRLGWLAGVASVCGIAAYEVSCVSDNNNTDPCPVYCQNIESICTGDDGQYPSPDTTMTCLRICEAIDAGAPGQSGDTIACRSDNVSNAKDDLSPAMHHADCVQGGVSALCVNDQCTSFCNAIQTLCTPARTGYPDFKHCHDTCVTWPQEFNGPLIGSTGDTLQCRTYHFELSQTGNAADLETHCPHTGVISAKCFNADGGAGDAGNNDAAPGDAAPADAAAE